MTVDSATMLFRNVEFRSKRSRAFAEYWATLPKRDLIPSRADFDPGEQGPILSTYVIHELVSPEEIIVRLAGTAVGEGYGFETTGHNYLDLVAEERRPSASRAIHLICEHPCGMVVRLATETKTGLVRISEVLALPMRDADGAARLVYYQANPEPVANNSAADEDELVNIDVGGRLFIDIGAGVPDFSG